jgi:hypothetical protein
VKPPQLAGLSTVHQPLLFASISFRNEVTTVPKAGTIQKKQMTMTAALTSSGRELPPRCEACGRAW